MLSKNISYLLTYPYKERLQRLKLTNPKIHKTLTEMLDVLIFSLHVYILLYMII